MNPNTAERLAVVIQFLLTREFDKARKEAFSLLVHFEGGGLLLSTSKLARCFLEGIVYELDVLGLPCAERALLRSLLGNMVCHANKGASEKE